MTAGDVFVGLGTLALALFTAWLAWKTSAEVKHGETQLRLTQESIEAIDRPFVVVSRRDEEMAELLKHGTILKFALSNLGKGPGIVNELTFVRSAGQNLLEKPLGEARSLAPGNLVRFELSLTKPLQDGEMLTMKTLYSSASGYRYCTESRLQFRTPDRFSYQGHRRTDLGIDSAIA
jgi:hypothetical protein